MFFILHLSNKITFWLDDCKIDILLFKLLLIFWIFFYWYPYQMENIDMCIGFACLGFFLFLKREFKRFWAVPKILNSRICAIMPIRRVCTITKHISCFTDSKISRKFSIAKATALAIIILLNASFLSQIFCIFITAPFCWVFSWTITPFQPNILHRSNSNNYLSSLVIMRLREKNTKKSMESSVSSPYIVLLKL